MRLQLFVSGHILPVSLLEKTDERPSQFGSISKMGSGALADIGRVDGGSGAVVSPP